MKRDDKVVTRRVRKISKITSLFIVSVSSISLIWNIVLLVIFLPSAIFAFYSGYWLFGFVFIIMIAFTITNILVIKGYYKIYEKADKQIVDVGKIDKLPRNISIAIVISIILFVSYSSLIEDVIFYKSQFFWYFFAFVVFLLIGILFNLYVRNKLFKR